MFNVVHIGVNFCGKSPFENNAIHKFNNGVDWLFNSNEDKQKDLYGILDYHDDLNTPNFFKMNKVFYDDNNSNPLNYENRHKDDIISYEYYSLLNRMNILKNC